MRKLRFLLVLLFVFGGWFTTTGALAVCIEYNELSSLLTAYPAATSAGTYAPSDLGCIESNRTDKGLYYNTDTGTYILVRTCASCTSPATLIPHTATLDNGCTAEFEICGLTCSTTTTKPSGSNATTIDVSHCSSYSTYYAILDVIPNVYWTIHTCNTCQSGYYRYETSYTNAGGGYCAMTYYDCAACTAIPSYGSWNSYGTGYERRLVTYSWSGSGCGSNPSSTYEYRCAAGYYGSPTNGSSGCTKCNESFTNTCTVSNGTGTQTCYKTSSPAGSTSSSACTGTANCTSCCATSCSSGYRVSNCACVADVTTITFRSGNYTMTQTCTPGQSVSLKARSNMTAPVSSTYGWSFDGWATAAGPTTAVYDDGESITCPSSNTTLYGVWSRTVDLYYYGSAGATALSDTERPQYYRNTSTTAASPTSVTSVPLYPNSTYGWAPLGWRYDSAPASATATQTGTSTISLTPPADGEAAAYAVYWRTPQIAYDANGGEDSMSNSNCNSVQYYNAGGNATTDIECTLQDNGFPARSGYDFNGWRMGSPSGTHYNEGEEVTFPYSDWDSSKTYTAYADWVSTGVTITIDKNGGTGSLSIVSVSGETPTVSTNSGTNDATVTCKPGAVFRVSGVSRSGYSYDGLSTSSSGPGSSSITCPSSSGSTYYMVWSIDTVSCITGEYLQASGTCKECENGYWCPGGTFTPNGNIQGRNNCPSVTSGWTYVSGTGWDDYDQCQEYKTVSTCYTGYQTLTKTATSSSAWGTATGTLKAPKGYYVSGSGDNKTCSICTGATYQDTDGSAATSCTSCPSGYNYNADTPRTSINNCYTNSCTVACSGNDTSSCPAHAACTYNTGYTTSGTKQNYNGSCNASSSLCPVATVSCSSGYYLTNNNECDSCPSGCTCAGGTSQPDCPVSCDANEYLENNECYDCPSEFPYSEGGTHNIAWCYRDCVASDVTGAATVQSGGKRYSDNSGNTCRAASCSSGYFYTSSSGICTPCSTVNNTTSQQTGTDTTSTSTCPDGSTTKQNATATSQSYTRTCNGKYTGGAGGTSGSSACTGCSSYGSKSYGTCCATTCSSGYHVDNCACVQDAPTSCPDGQYLNGNTCSPCTGLPNNAAWTGSGTTATNCPWQCNANYYKSGSSCVVCNVSFSNSCAVTNGTGTQTCYHTSSPAGSTSSSACTGTANCGSCCATTCSSGYHVDNCACVQDVTCSAGQYLNGNTCSPCTGLPNHASWTGSGTTATNCPWQCNAGYTGSSANGDTGCVADSSESFTVTTTPGTTTLSFYLQPNGVYSINCGGGTLSGSGVNGRPSDGYTVSKSNTTSKYTCTWSSGGVHTVTIGATSTGQNSYTSLAANVTDSADCTPVISFDTETKLNVAAVSGNMSRVFPYNTSKAIGGAGQPRFCHTFAGCANLTTISGGLFADYTKAANNAFHDTFNGCTSLTAIPSSLFENITTATARSFAGTFAGCSTLTSIPDGLFSHLTTIDGIGALYKASAFEGTFRDLTGVTRMPENLFGVTSAQNTMFADTFNGCSNMGSYIPPSTFAGLISASSPQNSTMWKGTFQGTLLLTQCPEGTKQFITHYEGSRINATWQLKVSCEPCPTGYTSNADRTDCVLPTVTVSAGGGYSAVSATGWTGTGTATMTKTYNIGDTITLSNISGTLKNGYSGIKYLVNGTEITGTYTVTGDATITVAATGITTPTAEISGYNYKRCFNCPDSAETFKASSPGTYDSGITVYYKFGWATTSEGTYTYESNWHTNNTYTVAKDARRGTTYVKVQVYATDGTLTSETAIYSKSKYLTLLNRKLTFNATTNGGTLSGTSPVYVSYENADTYSTDTGTTARAIPTATKSGNIFNGWYTAASAGTKVINADGTLTGIAVTNYTNESKQWVMTSDKTVYAQFGTCAACVNGTGAQNCSVIVSNNACVYSATCLTGYSTNGGADTGTSAICSGESCICHPKSSAVTLNANGGTAGKTTSVTATYGVAMPELSATNLPTRAGYTFVGFYDTDAATGGTQYYTSVGASARTWDKIGDQILYARWTQCAANSYCPGDNTSVTCTSATSSKYTQSAAGSTSINDCYLTLTAGQRVATAGAGASVCGSNTYSTSTANIYYGGTSTWSHPTTSSCTNCTSGYTTSGTEASNHDAVSDCSITITLKKNGSTGTIQGTDGTNDASVTCQESVTCNFGSAGSLVPTSGGYTMTGGWGTANNCSAITASFTTPTTTTYYACKSACSYTNSTAATPSSNVCAGTCKTGYSTSGGSNTGTAASCSGTACTCSPKTFTVTLDDNSGSGGSGTIYTTYNTNVYKDSGRSNAMTSSAYPVTKPSKPSGYKFLGYYNSSNGTTQYIDENGYITSAGLSAGKALTANGTWYARYESMSVGIPVAVSHTYDGTAKSCDGDIDVEVPASGATVTYSETANGTYSATIPNITNSGEKTIYFKVSAPGYSDYYGSYWCTMNQLTLTPTSGTITYPTTTTTFTAACASGGPVTVSSRDTGVATVSRSSTPTNGAYTVTVTWGGTAGSTLIDVNCTEVYEAEGDEEIESMYAPVNGTYSITTSYQTSTVTLKNGSTTVDTVTATYGSAMPVKNTSNANLTMPTSTNYAVFMGYYDAATGGTQYYTAALASARTWNKTGAQTLNAQFATCTCTPGTNVASCEATGVSGNKCQYSYTCNDGYHVGSSGTTATGTFTATNAATASNTSPNCSGNTITLSWANGGHGTAPTTPASCTYGGTFTTAAAITGVTGYTFNNWSVNSKTFSAGAANTACNYTNLGKYSGTATITATWTAQTSTVTLNANGGTAGATTSVTATYDAAMPAIASANLPTRTGYTFAGFYDTDAATGGNMYYKADGTSNANWNKTGAQTLYARWTAQTSTVTLNKNTSSSDTTVVTTVTATYDAAMPAKDSSNNNLAVPTRSKANNTTYAFNGYYDARTGGTKYYNADLSSAKNWNKTGAQTLYAQWTMTCDAGYYLPANSLACDACPDGSYCAGGTAYSYSTSDQGINSCTAKTASSYTHSGTGPADNIARNADTDCYVTTTAGKYIASAKANTQTACTAAYYCPSTDVFWNTTGGRFNCNTGTAAGTATSPWTSVASATARTECYRNITLNKNSMSGTLALPSNSGCKSLTTNTGTTAQTLAVYYDTTCTLPTTALSRNASTTTSGLTGTTSWATTANAVDGFVTSIKTTSIDATMTYYAGRKISCAAGYYLAAGGTTACTICSDGNYCPGVSQVFYDANNVRGLNSCVTDAGAIYTKSNKGSANTIVRNDIGDCYATTTAGKYVAAANDRTETDCPTSFYCPSTTVYYGKTGGQLNCNDGKATTTSSSPWTSDAGTAARTSCYRNIVLNKNLMSGTLTLPANSGCRSLVGTSGSDNDTLSVYYNVECKLPTTILTRAGDGATTAALTSTGKWGTANTTASGFVDTIKITATTATITYYADKQMSCTAGYQLPAKSTGACATCSAGGYCPGISGAYYSTAIQGNVSCATAIATNWTSKGGASATNKEMCYYPVTVNKNGYSFTINAGTFNSETRNCIIDAQKTKTAAAVLRLYWNADCTLPSVGNRTQTGYTNGTAWAASNAIDAPTITTLAKVSDASVPAITTIYVQKPSCAANYYKSAEATCSACSGVGSGGYNKSVAGNKTDEKVCYAAVTINKNNYSGSIEAPSNSGCEIDSNSGTTNATLHLHYNTACTLPTIAQTTQAPYIFEGLATSANIGSEAVSTSIAASTENPTVTTYYVRKLMCAGNSYKSGDAACAACPTAYPNNDAGTSGQTACYANVTLNKNGYSGTLTAGTGTGCSVAETKTGNANGVLKVFYNTACTLPTISGFTQTGYMNSSAWSTANTIGGAPTTSIAASTSAPASTIYVQKPSCAANYYKNNTTTCSVCSGLASGGYPKSVAGNNSDSKVCYAEITLDKNGYSGAVTAPSNSGCEVETNSGTASTKLYLHYNTACTLPTTTMTQTGFADTNQWSTANTIGASATATVAASTSAPSATTYYALKPGCVSPYYKSSMTACSACSSLATPSSGWVTGGTYSSVSPYDASTTCRYKVTDMSSAPTNCSAVTTNTVSYGGSAWNTNFYTVTAMAGSYISSNNNSAPTCTQCATGSYTASAGTQTSCEVCGSGTTTSAAGKTSCDATCSNNNAYDNAWATPSWNNNSPTGLCKITNCKSGSYYTSTNSGNTNTCTACADGSFMASNAHTTTACTLCSSLTGVSPTGGTYSTGGSTGSTANTACQYLAPDKTITGCKTVTSQSVTYSGTAWPASTYGVTASKGYVIANNNKSNATCTACTGATYQATDGATVTSCSNCPTAETNWTQGTGTAWTAVTSCFETRNATDISSYCSAGVAKKFATNTTTWGTASASTAFQAKAGSFVSGLNCVQCATGSYTASAGTQTSCSVCGSGTTTSGAGKTSCDANCSNNNAYDNAWATPSWNNNSPTGLCKITNCKSGSYYTSTNSGNTNTCTACADGSFMASNAHTTTACTLCSSLTGVSPSGGTYSTGGSTGSTANTACQYLAPDKTITGCKTVTSQSVTYSGTAWPASTYGVTANKGYVIANNNKSNATCTACTGATYQATDGATATTCSACPNQTSGWTRGTGTAWTAVTSCYETRTPADCASGTIKHNATNSTTWGSDSVTTALTATANHYVSGTTCPTCSSGTNSNYTLSAAGTTSVNDCYLNTTATKYVGTAGSGEVACVANSYCPGGTKVYYGGTATSTHLTTGGSIACASPYTKSAASSDDANDCYLTTTSTKYVASAGAGETACLAGGYCAGGATIYKGGTVSGRNTIGGITVCAANTWSNASAASCTACTTAKGYGNSGSAYSAHSGVASCKVTCSGGQYVATQAGGCVNVGAGNWCAGGTVAENATLSRTACATGLTTIGFGPGADEAADCGHKFHAGEGILYLRSVKKTTPSLNVRIGDAVFYGNMSTSENVMSVGTTKKLKINNGGTIYHVHDDSVDLPTGYTLMEYIQGGGSSYIDSGMKAKNTMRVETTFKRTSGSGAPFGNYADTSAGYTFCFWTAATTANSYTYNSSNTKVDMGVKLNASTWYDLVLDEKNGTASVGGVTKTFATKTFTTAHNMPIFARYHGTNGLGLQMTGQMKNFTVYDDDVLVFKGIPVKRNSDNKCGLYDMVSGQFFGSATSTAFTCQ